MARTARKMSSIDAYHIIIRGQKKLFLSQDDISEFFTGLKKYFNQNTAELYSYSIESKKIHLVFRLKTDINYVIKPLLTSYARYYNRVHKQKGKLFYDRYMSEPLNNNDAICDAVVFVHSKSSDTSYNEYVSKKNNVCSVLSLRGASSYDNIIAKGPVKLLLDDYASMSDRELKNYILGLYGKKLSSLSSEEKKKIAAEVVSSSNLTKTRVCRLLDIGTAQLKDVSKREKKPQVQNNNRELSVWLL